MNSSSTTWLLGSIRDRTINAEDFEAVGEADLNRDSLEEEAEAASTNLSPMLEDHLPEAEEEAVVGLEEAASVATSMLSKEMTAPTLMVQATLPPGDLDEAEGRSTTEDLATKGTVETPWMQVAKMITQIHTRVGRVALVVQEEEAISEDKIREQEGTQALITQALQLLMLANQTISKIQRVTIPGGAGEEDKEGDSEEEEAEEKGSILTNHLAFLRTQMRAKRPTRVLMETRGQTQASWNLSMGIKEDLPRCTGICPDHHLDLQGVTELSTMVME